MKHLKKLFAVLAAVLLTGVVQAQQIKLRKYKFGEGLNFSAADGDYTMELTGFIQPWLESRKYLDNDDIRYYNRFRMRRARFTVAGRAKQEKIFYRLQLDLSGSGEADADLGGYLLDAYVGYEINDNWSVSFGQKATPTDNRELGMRSNTLQLVERSQVTSAFSSIREFGLFIDGSYRLVSHLYIKPSVAVTNGDGVNAFGRDRGGFKYGGRLDVLPFGLFSNFGQYRQVDMVRELTPKFVIGTTYSYNEGISDRRGRESGTILYLNDQCEETLPDYIKFGVDFLFKYQGFSAIGEYVKATAKVPGDLTQRIREDGSIATTFPVNGIDDVANYVKGRMMVGEGYNFQAGYLFKNNISVDGQFTHLKPEANSFLNNGTFNNRSHFYTLGISKYLDRNYGAQLQLAVTYVNARPGSNNVNAEPINGNELIGRMMMTISF
ncbi:MAG: porin [Flavobacterium sp.]